MGKVYQYQKYPKLKYNTDWQHNFPDEWKIKPIKFCVKLINDKSDFQSNQIRTCSNRNVRKTGIPDLNRHISSD